MQSIIKFNLIFIICTLLLLVPKKGCGQEEKTMHHTIGLNLLQLPATTIDITYAFSNNPQYDFLINSGFTFNYSKSIDYIGWLLSPHFDCGNDGFTMIQQSGAFLKGGMKYNVRKSFDKKYYFFFSAYVCGSWIYEEAEKTNRLKHHKFIYGFTGNVGFHINIYKKISTDIAVNISYTPDKTVKDLYGYENYIPGMGFMETCGSNKCVFPMIVWSIKYQIQ
ncbi:MAG TPA: hypothetical protein PK495_01670 [Bacteroidales bacterium]|jgi:hypothetical protein|nr:hypothetical protein [Bacteroidales bacterium]HQB19266.1 hypothetical protein [Bacteroidales bacterium]